MDLTKTFSHEQFVRALESWSWAGVGGLGPRFTSLFGDVFLESRDGTWWHLDTFEGTLQQPWQNVDELRAALATEEGQDEWLIGGLALGAYHRRGLRLDDNQVYAWAPPPIVTGSFEVDEIQVFDFVVVVNLAGQLHDQLRDKPEGFQVNEFRLAD